MPPDVEETLARKVVQMCVALPPAGLGFAAAGICDTSPTQWRQELISWLEAGRHGSMAYLQDNLQARLDVNMVLPGAHSAIMVADQYARRGQRDEPLQSFEQPAGRIARYARSRDYHTVIKNRLHTLADALRQQYPGEQFRAFVDTAPLPEREYSARAGLGWVGKHTLIIHPRLGSYTLLGGVLTTMQLQAPPDQAVVHDHCGTCTRCIDACPTSAISPYSVDATRCISYLTIERRAPISPEFHEAIGDWLYGCDICQEVCPHNSARPSSFDAGTPHPDYTAARQSLPLLDVLAWKPEDRARTLKGSAMKRATLDMMKRNALIVAGNLLARREDPALRERLAQIAADQAEPEMVRLTAAQVVRRFG